MFEKVICTYFPKCRGCSSWNINYNQQIVHKLDQLKNILNLSNEWVSTDNFISIAEYGIRHRFDFTFEIDSEQKMGFYDENRNLLDLKVCLQLSPELQKIYEEFRAIQINQDAIEIKKGSVRLRVGPTGLKGCWLDLANKDIKFLIDDSRYLNKLLEAGFQVEIGQKGKFLKKINSKLKLTDPYPLNWFQTINYQHSNMPIASLISDFTQPSWLSAEKIVQLILSWIEAKKINSVIEFGPGVGQLTLPLLSKGLTVQAYESSLKAVEALKRNAKTYQLEQNLTVNLGDFQNKELSNLSTNYDLVLVNPPRSGLKNFVQVIVETRAPLCIYISCYPESMKVDIEQLQTAGYQIKSAKIIDQFPQTSHFECCVLLERVSVF